MANIKAIHRLSLFDPATGDVVLINRLSTDGGYEKEPIATEVSDGTIFGGYTHTLTAIFFDMPAGARAQLETWEEAGTELNCVGLSGTGALLWYHPTEMTGFIDSLQTNARDGVSPFQFALTTSVPYADIYTGTNIVRAAAKRNSDGRTQYDQTTDYVPKRMTPDDGQRYQLADFGVTTLAATATNTVILMPFPMPNVDFSASVDGDPSGGANEYSIEQRNFAGTILTVDSGNNYGTQTGFSTVSGIYQLRFIQRANAVSNGTYMRTDKHGYTNA